jgi:hypothetical protein
MEDCVAGCIGVGYYDFSIIGTLEEGSVFDKENMDLK